MPDDIPPPPDGYSATPPSGGMPPPPEGFSAAPPKKSTPLSKSTVNAQGQSTYMPSEAATPTPGASPFRQPAPQPQSQQAPEPPWWEIAARGIARQGLPTPGVPSTVQAYQQMKARGETPGIVPGTLKMISPAAAKAYQENKGAGPEILRILGSLLEPEQLTSFPQLAALGVSKPISRLAAGAFAANQASIARQKYLQGDPGAAVVQGLIGAAAAVPEVASRLRARGASTPAPSGEAATTPAPTATPVTAGEGQVPPHPGALTASERSGLENAMAQWRNITPGEGIAPAMGGRAHGIGQIAIGKDMPVNINTAAHEFAHAFDDVTLRGGTSDFLSDEIWKLAKATPRVGHREIVVDAPGLTESGKWMIADGNGSELLTRSYANMVEHPGAVEKYAPGVANAVNRASQRANIPTPEEARQIMQGPAASDVPPGTGIVARHGETPLNVKSPDAPEGYFRGFENPPLTENGQAQVAQSADVLKQKGVGTVYAGDLTRHTQSQDIIAQKTGATAVPPTPALRPLDLGDLNGQKITEEGNQRVLDAVLKNPDQPLPGSTETPNQWKQRVLGAWQDLQAQHANDPNPFSIVTSYRNVKLIEAWEAAGRPQDLSIDPKVFAEDHHPPGSLMQVSPGEPTKVISAPGESPHGISPPKGEPQTAVAQQPTQTPQAETPPRLYREGTAEEYLHRDFANPGKFWTDNPDLALGQGQNKGVIYEFQPKSMSHFRENAKPGTALPGVGKEYVVRNDVKTISGQAMGDIVSVTFKKGVKVDPVTKANLLNFSRENNPNRSFTREVLPNGDTKFTRIIKGEPNAPIQGQQVEGAGTPDVRAGEGGQAGPRGGVRQGPSDQGQISETPGTRQTQEGQVDVTSARKAMMAQDREALDLPQLPDAERKSWQTTLQNAQDKNLSQNAGALARVILDKPRSLTDEETAGMVLRAQEIKNAHRSASEELLNAKTPEETAIAKAKQDSLQNEFDTISAALKKSGTEKGRTLAAQKLTINQNYDLVSVASRMKAANPEKPVTPQEMAQAQKYTDKIAELESRIADLEKNRPVRVSLNRAAREVPEGFGKTNTIFTEERANAARQRIQEKLGRLSAGVDPTLLKDVVEVGGYYLEGGLRSFAAWSRKMKDDFPKLSDDHIKAAWTELTNDKRLQASKNIMARNLEDVQGRIAEGGTEKLKPPAIVPDKEAIQMRSQLDQARGKLDAMIEARRPKTIFEKITGLNREFILSGYSVFEKLLGATLWNMPVETLADALGAGISRVARAGDKPLSAIAAKEGAFSLGAEAKGYKGLVSKQAFKNAKDMLLTGSNEISALAGFKPKANELGGYVGRLHGTEKSFLQTAQFDKSLEMRLNRAAQQGRDITNPEVQIEVGVQAARDAQSQILQNDNALSSGINGAISAFERNKNTGMQALGTFFRTLVPITRVPANYLGRAVEMTGTGLLTGAAKHIGALREMAKTGEPMPPEVADSIVRSYKYGGLGLVAAYIGLTQPDWFKSAGFFGGTTNRDQNGNPMEFDTLQVAGLHVPRLLSHSPMALAIQFWATIRNEIDQGKPMIGVQRGVLGMMEQLPGAVSISQIAHAPNLQQAGGRYFGNLIIPQMAQQGAKAMDQTPPPKPGNFGEELMSRTPFLRQQVEGTAKASKSGGFPSLSNTKSTKSPFKSLIRSK